MRSRSYSRGYTIIEILIVITVMAILATVLFFSVRGYRDRAENTKTLNAVSAFARAIKIAEARKGKLGYDVSACLGKIGENCAGPNNCRTMYQPPFNLPVDNQPYGTTAESVSSLPLPSDRVYPCATGKVAHGISTMNFQVYSGGTMVDDGVFIVYYLKDVSSCGAAGSAKVGGLDAISVNLYGDVRECYAYYSRGVN